MPEPPSSTVYWQLSRIDGTPEMTPAGGYIVQSQASGLLIDLTDGLMAESLLDRGEPSFQPEVILSISKDDPLIEHVYTWTAPPIYLEPEGEYPITVRGRANLSHIRLNSRLTPYVLDEQMGRISADGYNNYPDSLTYTITTDNVLRDGRIVASIVIRDENEMFRYRVDYTYEMHDGRKPKPTPYPGFLSVDLVRGGAPAYYDETGMEGVWRVTNTPDEFRAFGSMNGGEPRFYPADAFGNVVRGVPPVNVTDDFMTYVQGFVATKPAELPPYYQELADGVYGFTSRDGQLVTRGHGRVDGGKDAFFPMVGDPAVVSTIQGPVDPAQDYADLIEGFGVAAPDLDVPHYRQSGNVYSFVGRDGVTQHRVYGRLNGADPAFYPSTENGEVRSHAPVDPNADFDAYIKGFDAAEPAAIPSYYRQADDGLFYVLDRDGAPRYRVFGVLDGEAPEFYPADANGNRQEGAPPVFPEDDFSEFIAGFEPETPVTLPQFYTETDVPGVWSFQDIDGRWHYRAFGGLNRGDPAFYVSDAQGNVAVDALPVYPSSDLLILPPPPVFSATTPEDLPSFYTPVPGYSGVYSFVDEDGETNYRVFGGYDEEEPAFYPSNATGTLQDDAEPVSVEDDEQALPKPSATPITFIVVTKSPEDMPPQQVNHSVAPRPAATSYTTSIVPTPSPASSMPPVIRTVIAPLPTPFATYTIVPTHSPTSTPAAITRMYEAPSPTPYAYEIVTDASPAPSAAPTIVRVYTAPPATPRTSTVNPTSVVTDAPTPITVTVAPTSEESQTAGGTSGSGGTETAIPTIAVTTDVSITPGATQPTVETTAPVTEPPIATPPVTATAAATTVETEKPTETPPVTATASSETEAPESTSAGETETQGPSEETPAPTDTEGQAATEEPGEEDTQEPSGNATWWIVGGGALAALLGFGARLLTRRKK